MKGQLPDNNKNYERIDRQTNIESVSSAYFLQNIKNMKL